MKLSSQRIRAQIIFLVHLQLIPLSKSFILSNTHNIHRRSATTNLKLHNKKISNEDYDTPTTNNQSRRDFLSKAIVTTSSCIIATQTNVLPFTNTENYYANAADETPTLTEKLYNPDGTLKDEESSKVTYNAISFDLPSSNPNSVPIKGTFEIPSKWTKNDYFDQSINFKACNSISVFAPSTLANLQKAASVGVAKALQLDSSLVKSDLVSAKKRYITVNNSKDEGQEELEVYDFDLAVAPSTCNEGSKENLGLGFCPYEDIVLVSAVNWNEKTYVFQLKCDRGQWRRSNSDLKQVRKSFTIAVK